MVKNGISQSNGKSEEGQSMKLQGKVAVVTGAASGIGREIARTYAREGAKVVIADLNQQGADAVAAELGGASTAIGVAMDVTSEDQVEAGVAKAIGAFGRLDILVSNFDARKRNSCLRWRACRFHLSHGLTLP